MRVRPVPTALLIVLVTLIAKTSGEDLYLEGEGDSANEFLEVNEESGIGSAFTRLKRHLTTGVNRLIRAVESTTSMYEFNTEDPDIDEDEDADDDADGSIISQNEGEIKEKTVRVTFVVMEPYQPKYSNRDSPVFQNFSTSLSTAVNELFSDLPGHHKTSLVRIQSRPTDEFSCKVTLDISSFGYDDTDTVIKLLRDQIETGKLGPVTVNDADFSATVNDAGYNPPLDTCAADEFQCGDKSCLPKEMRCNNVYDCEDQSDEENCPQDLDVFPEQETEEGSNKEKPCKYWVCPGYQNVICDYNRCDQVDDCPDGADEVGCPKDGDVETQTESDYEEPTPTEDVAKEDTSIPTFYPPPDTTTPSPVQNFICQGDDFKCDETRCIPSSSRCDRRQDCDDGSDEAQCPRKS